MFRIFKDKKVKVVENQYETTPNYKIKFTGDVPTVYWIVQWDSRFGKYSNDVIRTSIPFFSKDQANEFAESLKQAHALLRNTNDINIVVLKIIV